MPRDGESYDGDINAWKEDNFELHGFKTVERDGVRVHTFTSTGRCYNETQCSDLIKDGDVLVIPSEGVAGYLFEAWPVAVTKKYGDLHGLLMGAALKIDEDSPGAPMYQPKLAMAETIARENGWELDADIHREVTA